MSRTIRYLLDGQRRCVEVIDPTRTVLEHLRGDLRRTGTKEGCAEGDCGACTVVVGELTDGGVAWRAVNACILFMPMLDGKALITVESLGRRGAPHPVQTAMVEHHGSQCGFCTPGIVMSLYARAIGARGCAAPASEVLVGNLCRCTGYGPILSAAGVIAAEAAPDVALALRALRDGAPGPSEPSADGRQWFAPSTVEELAERVLEHPTAVLVAGATDVGLWVTKQRQVLETLIFIGDIEALHEVDAGRDILRIGAAVRYQEALEALAALSPDLGGLVRRLGSTQIRNSGTIGGNIANGSPIGDMAPALIALGARLILRRGAATREIDLEDFFIAYGRQDLRAGEFVEAVVTPRPTLGTVVKVFKLSKRFDQDISAVCGAFVLRMEDGRVILARIAFGGMAGTPRRALRCEAALIGHGWTAETVEQALLALGEDFAPLDDVRGSAAYRTLSAANLLRKVFAEITTTAPTRILERADG